MKQLEFSAQINAPKAKVWSILLNDKTYRLWASAFSEGSHAVGDWSEGCKMLFLGSEGKGISSMIARHIQHEFISIQHLGMIANGVEDFNSPETKKWSGALENYSVKEVDGGTELLIEMDSIDDYEAYFRETWPKALQKVKELSETT